MIQRPVFIIIGGDAQGLWGNLDNAKVINIVHDPGTVSIPFGKIRIRARQTGNNKENHVAVTRIRLERVKPLIAVVVA